MRLMQVENCVKLLEIFLHQIVKLWAEIGVEKAENLYRKGDFNALPVEYVEQFVRLEYCARNGNFHQNYTFRLGNICMERCGIDSYSLEFENNHLLDSY
jgi:hypothetical protein